jgi:hypothetical protein
VSRVYKIIAKVLANRLKRTIEKIISKPHNAFVRGRLILESMLIANECLDSMIRSREPWVLGQLDIEKAYEHFNCNFLVYFLGRCGFGEKWPSWIMHYISSV